MVEPAWAVADMATSGSNSETERRRFVNIVRLLFIVEVHHVRFPNEFGANRRPVTCSLRREAAQTMPPTRVTALLSGRACFQRCRFRPELWRPATIANRPASARQP